MQASFQGHKKMPHYLESHRFWNVSPLLQCCCFLSTLVALSLLSYLLSLNNPFFSKVSAFTPFANEKMFIPTLCMCVCVYVYSCLHTLPHPSKRHMHPRRGLSRLGERLSRSGRDRTGRPFTDIRTVYRWLAGLAAART